jgi:hypothetical protein
MVWLADLMAAEELVLLLAALVMSVLYQEHAAPPKTAMH